MNSRRMALGILLMAMAAAVVSAQEFPFELLVTQTGSAVRVPNGALLTLSSSVGQTEVVGVTATYSGAGQVTFDQPPSVIGSTAFSIAFTETLPLTLSPGQSVSFNIEFLPTSTTSSNAQLRFPFVEVVPPSQGNAGAITFSLQGSAASFTLSYVLQTDQNVVPLPPGGTIPFPPSPINTTAQALLNVTNSGSAPGTVSELSISGDAFRLSGLPLLPATVPAGLSLQVSVLYQPTEVRTDTGEISISFDGGGPPVTVKLEGSGSAPGFRYQILETDPPTDIVPGGTITFADTDLGQSSSFVILVSNVGNAEGRISSIALTGTAFQLSNTPILPQTLAPDDSLTFTVTFAPSAPEKLAGRLIINSDVFFELEGLGLGPQLAFSYLAGETVVNLDSENNSVVFSPVTITEWSAVNFTATNKGTVPATISNIGVGDANGPFSVSGFPALPLSLPPNGELRLKIVFTPVVLGFATGTLQFDTRTISLLGSGTQPPPLPEHTIIGPNGTAPPMTQQAIGLTLAGPYPAAVSGTLTLTISGDHPPDPAVQFATGGRTVQFVIPANSTDAVFGDLGIRIGLQTGTVASTLTLAPSFTTQAGNVDLTPEQPADLRFDVVPAPPVLVAGEADIETVNRLVLRVTGFTTTRSLTAWQVHFTPVGGVNIRTSQFTIDVGQVSTTWFLGAESQTFGGQFTMSIPFTFQGTLGGVANIASVSMTMNNELGSSNSVELSLR